MIFKSTKMKNLNKNLGKSQLYTPLYFSQKLENKRGCRNAKFLQAHSPTTRSDVKCVKPLPFTSLRAIGLMVLKTRGCAKQSKNVFSSFTSHHSTSFAFTLAEILIVLGIMGVLAAMTIPGLINDAKHQETVSKVKKAYTVISQAFNLAEANEGPVKDWGWIASNNGTGALNVSKIISPYLNIQKQCGNGTGCFPPVMYSCLNNTDCYYFNGANDFATAILHDGTSFGIQSTGADCSSIMGTSQSLKNVCGLFFVDVNGFKSPNQYGVDLFAFYITKYGIVPRGTSLETTAPYSSTCSNKFGKGYGCAGWIIEKGNMDYLQ